MNDRNGWGHESVLAARFFFFVVATLALAACTESDPAIGQDPDVIDEEAGETPEVLDPIVECRADADCDDGFNCTRATCNVDSGLCEYERDDAVCDDGLFCNGRELCDPSAAGADELGCAPGIPPGLADNISCTAGRCDEVGDQILQVANDAACEDENECTVGRCDPLAGCTFEALEDGARCGFGGDICLSGECVNCVDSSESGVDDGCGGPEPFCVEGRCSQCLGDADCSGALTCEDGVCTGCTRGADCDDGLTCTVDSCNAVTRQCEYSYLDSLCDDGDACNGEELCVPAAVGSLSSGCVSGEPLDISDGIDCTVDRCNPGTGVVRHEPDSSLCDNGNPCVEALCTPEGCETTMLPAGTLCEDDSFCDGQGNCGSCADTTVGGVDSGCDDEAPACVTGVCATCEAAGPGCPLDCAGIVDGPNTEDPCGTCDDNPSNDCIIVPICEGNECELCEADDDCDDANPCTVESCVEGRCRTEFESLEGDACPAPDICTAAAECRGGICTPTEERTCDDPCTRPAPNCGEGSIDFFSCIPNRGASCDDGLVFTANDTCDGFGRCIGECAGADGEPCPEADGNPCTVPTCDEETGCSEQLQVGLQCETACGEGVCTDDASCQPLPDVCDRDPRSVCATYECRPELGGCVYTEGDFSCELPGTSCDQDLGLCYADERSDAFDDEHCDIGVPNFFDDGYDLAECPTRSFECGVNRDASCRTAFRSQRGLGAWRAHQSLAYGFPASLARQSNTLYQMLADGVLWLHLIVDYCDVGGDSGELCLCTGDDQCGAASTRLEGRLEEIGQFLRDYPNTVAGIYLEAYASNEDIRDAFDAAGLRQYLYGVPTGYRANEQFLMTTAQMVAESRRLVVIGGGFFPRTHMLIGDTPQYEAEEVGPALPVMIFENNTAPDQFFNCVTETQRSPTFGAFPPTFYARVHNNYLGVDGFVGASCWNRFVTNGENHCEETIGREPDVTFVHYYNSHPAPLNNFDVPNDFVSACTWDDPEFCTTDSDCDRGVCGPFLTCVNCNSNDDCEQDQYCNGFFGTCFADLPDGGVCTEPEECQSGVCSLFVCTSCESNADCSDDEFCDVFGGCQDRRGIGGGCLSGVECLSGNCFGGFCVACDENADCTDGEFCTLNPLPGQSACIPPKPIGSTCAQNFECESGDCFLGFCVACNEQSDCPDESEFCSLDPRPGESTCIPRKEDSLPCAQNLECASGNCYLGFCVECNEQVDCDAPQFCSLNPSPGESRCIDPKPIGATCAQGLECASGNCYLGFCVACNEQGDCPDEDEFCSLDPLPGESACITRKDDASLCAQNFECASGNCYLGFCVECNEQGDCTDSNEFCSLDPAPAASRCIERKPNGELCAQGFECSSGQCTAFVCGECASDANCPSSQHCDAFNNCANDVGNNSPCVKDSACTTGICLAGFCAQCVDDGDCNESQHCDALNDCVADVPNGAPCLRDSACQTELCLAGFCAQCVGDGDCPSSQHCDAFNNCVDDVGNGSPCLKDAACDTGICLAGFCAQCVGDGDCPSSQHCDAFNNCVDDVGNNAPCLKDAACDTGICSAGFCAQCTNDGHCNSNQFCNGGGDCQDKVPNGSLCVESRVCQSGCCGLGFCGGPGC